MSTIKFRIAAKTDVGLVRTNNEDNFQASADLSDGQMRWVNNEICSLGEKGALIVVADGMGGMNAGEVASELAIETVREYFAPDRLTPEVMKTRFSIEKYMNDAIVAADARIKTEAKGRPETKGMGTTIVIGWILDGKLYLSWCGDSRAYVYNPAAGLHQISKDHSYVQSLVDKGSITRDEAFDFPDSNIITRCLSDGAAKARPESLLKPYDVCDNDIIMLCTDGLSGMIRDAEIESIIKSNEHNMDTLVDELIKAACDAEGADNITICLCQILQGGGECNPEVFVDYDKRLNGNKDNFIRTLISKPEKITPKSRHFWYIGIVCILIALICGAVWWFAFRDKPEETPEPKAPTEDVQTPAPSGPASAAVNQPAAAPASQEVPAADDGKKPAAKDDGKTESTIFPKSAEPAPAADSGQDDSLTIIHDQQSQPEITLDEFSKMSTERYTVKKGDTYSALARQYNISMKRLMQLNDSVPLKTGDVILVPKK